MQQIRPLPGSEAGQLPAADRKINLSTELKLEDAPNFDTTEEVKLPDTPRGRLDRWQRKLLDLSLRNSLLNFRAGKRSARIVAPDPAALEDALALRKELRLLAHPGIMTGIDPRDAEIHRQRYKSDAVADMAHKALEKSDVYIELGKEDLEDRLTELYRAAKTAMEEGGTNILYLAIGFLSWTKDKTSSDKTHKAPLILLPVQLQRKSIKSGFRLTATDDEPRFNPTLLQMLLQDYRIRIPSLEKELPKDDSGLHVKKIWDMVQQAVKEIPHWEVSPECVISTFSFAKFLMWKDLVDRTAQLKRNPIVRHLIETPREPYGEGAQNFPDVKKLDVIRLPQSVFCPMAADSSQLAAVIAAADGKDFVLIGPPGTGKSQTICNIITQCLAEEKKVLFVSEKMAALEVVHRRLAKAGLGEFCLELHSAKARKTDVLSNLKRAWEARSDANETQWLRHAEQLHKTRTLLNKFVNHLHMARRNGLSVFQAIGIACVRQNLPQLHLSWASHDAHDEADFEKLKDAASQLGALAVVLEDAEAKDLTLVKSSQWTIAWADRFMTASKRMAIAGKTLVEAATIFADTASLPKIRLNRNGRAILAGLAAILPQAAGHDWGFMAKPGSEQVILALAGIAQHASAHARAQTDLSSPYRPETTSCDLESLNKEWNAAQAIWWPKRIFSKARIRKILRSLLIDGKVKPDPGKDLGILIELHKLEQEIAELSLIASQATELSLGLKTNFEAVRIAAGFFAKLSSCLKQLTHDSGRASEWNQALHALFTTGNSLLSPGARVERACVELIDAVNEYEVAERELLEVTGSSAELFDKVGAETPEGMIAIAGKLSAAESKLRNWCAWQASKAQAVALGIGELAEAVEAGRVSAADSLRAFEANYCRWWLRGTIDNDEVLRSFVSIQHERHIDDFKRLDDHFTNLTRDIIKARLCAGMPHPNSLPKGESEWGFLRHEMEKKKRHAPVRHLIASLPSVLTKLSPCLLMSPLSVAQYLSPETAPFDVVIFDEASQIPVWDAVGAMARGKQTVIVGDPKQLPPTNFFNRAEGDEDLGIDLEDDLESILDECLGANLPSISLNWHYRSRHESLITFSNHRYYAGRLVTFPSPATEDRAVSFHYVADGVYEKGGARTNLPEARAVVADVLSYIRNPDFRGMTHGIVTFNAEQQSLILDLLDEERRKDFEVDGYFSEDAAESLFVKNLESVQGDERDYIWFSIGFGPDRTRSISMNFGPINQRGGERRLNVAITRARHGLRVFSSIRASEIDLARTAAVGVRDLRHFLEFAEYGVRAIPEMNMGSLGDHESPFETAVADALSRKGWRCLPQIGVSSFRIDLGVVHPEEPGRFLAGIECDGATYHRSATARDRDKLRQRILADLGWKIIRIWSTDWWLDPEGTLAKADRQLHSALEADISSRRAT